MEQHDYQPPDVKLDADELPKPWKCPDCGDVREARALTADATAQWIRLGQDK